MIFRMIARNTSYCESLVKSRSMDFRKDFAPSTSYCESLVKSRTIDFTKDQNGPQILDFLQKSRGLIMIFRMIAPNTSYCESLVTSQPIDFSKDPGRSSDQTCERIRLDPSRSI